MQITKSRLKQIIKEELRKEGFFGNLFGGGKDKPEKPPTKDSVIEGQYIFDELNDAVIEAQYELKNSGEELHKEIVKILDGLDRELTTFIRQKERIPFIKKNYDSIAMNYLIEYLGDIVYLATKNPPRPDIFKNRISKALQGFKTGGRFHYTVEDMI